MVHTLCVLVCLYVCETAAVSWLRGLIAGEETDAKTDTVRSDAVKSVKCLVVQKRKTQQVVSMLVFGLWSHSGLLWMDY